MKQTTGQVVAVSKQWWLKVNQKPLRVTGADGATYPHIIKVRYRVNGKDYTKRKWISPGLPVPRVGATIRLAYDESRPGKARLL